MNLARTINSNHIRKRIFVILVVFCCAFIIFLNLNSRPVVCYFKKHWSDNKTLPNVNTDEHLMNHRHSHNIFFHETSCTVDGTIWLNSRQACAIESAGE